MAHLQNEIQARVCLRLETAQVDVSVAVQHGFDLVVVKLEKTSELDSQEQFTLVLVHPSPTLDTYCAAHVGIIN